MAIRKPKYSLIAALLIALVFSFLKLTHPPNNPISYDVYGYYLYLPAAFVYDDIKLENIEVFEGLIEKYNSTPTFYQVTRVDDDKWVVRLFMGMSYFFSPGFFAAHIYASNSDLYPADGFSLPYQRGLWLIGLVYTLIGLFVLRKVLLRFFDDKISALILLLIYLGSNLFFFAVYGSDIPHVYLFTLYPVILWFTIRWHESHRPVHAIFLGLFLGILIISRPSEIFAIFIPLLWGVSDKKSLQEKIKLIYTYRLQVLFLALAMFAAIFPQLLYWKTVTGEWVYSTYNDPGSGLDLLSPHFGRALFGFRKGLFLYSPIMIFGFIGLIPLYRYNKSIFFGIFLFILFNTYIISSFSTLFSFGWRAFVQSYGVLVIPFGYFVYWVFRQKLWIRISFLAVVLFFTFVNLFQTWQLTKGFIDGSRMTGKYYCKTFLKTNVTEEDRKLLLIQRPVTSREYLTNEADYQKRLLTYFDYEEPERGKEKYYDTSFVRSGNYSLRMDSTYQFSPSFKIRFKDLTDDYYAWIRLTVYVYPTNKLPDDDAMLVSTFTYKGQPYKWRKFGINDIEGGGKLNEWNKLTFDYLTPEARSRKDQLEVYIWYRGKADIYIDDLSVEVFEE